MKGSHNVSVIQGTYRICYITGRSDRIEKHHIYYGTKNRAVSDKYGFFVYLSPEFHRGTYGVHGKYGEELDLELKRECQRIFEADGHSREEFRKLIGESYL